MTDRPETHATVDMEEARRLARVITGDANKGREPHERFDWSALDAVKVAHALLVALEESEALRLVAGAAQELYERVEMDESIGVCLSSRIEALALGDALMSLASEDELRAALREQGSEGA